jgi:hypothetical protein
MFNKLIDSITLVLFDIITKLLPVTRPSSDPWNNYCSGRVHCSRRHGANSVLVVIKVVDDVDDLVTYKPFLLRRSDAQRYFEDPGCRTLAMEVRMEIGKRTYWRPVWA